MCLGNRILMEPLTKIFINCPESVMGDALRELQQRRAVIEDIHQEGEATIIAAKAPVAEMFGFASAIRGATQGRALWSTENSGFVPVPTEIQTKVVEQIRTRKGLKPEPYDAAYYSG
jgi:elongation factor 2